MKTVYGFYNDTRDVAHTRPSIFLPQSIYFDRTRNLGVSGDGITLFGGFRQNDHDFQLDFQLIKPRVEDKDTEIALLGRDMPGDFGVEKPAYLVRLTYDYMGGMLKFALSNGELYLKYDPDAPFPSDLRDGTFTFSPSIFTAQFNGEKFSVTAEYAYRALKFEDFGVPPLETSFAGESFYIHASYRFSEYIEIFARYDTYFSDREDKFGRDFEDQSGRPNYTRYALDTTLGIRYFITTDWMLAAEVHMVEGTGWLPALDNEDKTSVDKYWNMFAIQLSYRF